MQTSQNTLPCGRIVTVFSAKGKDSDEACYFNSTSRNAIQAPGATKQYRSQVHRLTTILTGVVKASGMHFDAMVCAPSSRGDAREYADCLDIAFSVDDLSDTFTRRHIMKASDPGVTVDMLATEEFIHRPDGSEAEIKSLLIVDDAFATGKTIAAMLQLLHGAGFPTNAEVSVAVCVNMNI